MKISSLLVFSFLLTSPLAYAGTIDIGSGTNGIIEVDYMYNANQPFIFKRYYNNALMEWRFDYDDNISYSNYNNIESITLTKADFQNIVFKKINNVWTDVLNNNNTTSSQIKIDLGANNDVVFTFPNGDKETYSSSNGELNNETVFRFTKKEKNNGQTLTIDYNGSSQRTITDDYGRVFTINYSLINSTCSNSKPKNFIGFNGKTITYDYNTDCVFNKVTYPDNNFIQYTYTSSGLDKKMDENNNVLKKYFYTTLSSTGKKATGEGKGNTGIIDKVSLDYSVANQVKVKDSFNNLITINLSTDILGNKKITGYSAFCDVCNGIQGTSLTYDSKGYIDTVVDFKGNTNKYSWNSKGKILTLTRAFNTPLATTVSYSYDSTGFLLNSKTEPVSGGNKVTTYGYDSKNQLTNTTITAPNGIGSNITKNIQLIYDIDQLTEIRGVNYASNNNDKVTLTYNVNGQIQTTTNELGQVTTYSAYNDYGNPTQISLPNSNIIDFTYDLRGRILSSSIKSSLVATDSETTTYTYDLAGLLTKITNPSSSFSKMTYDNTQRLTTIEEYSEPTTASPTGVYLGKIEYTLDNMSNATSVKIFNANNVQERVSTSQFDNKNRLFKTIGTLNQTTTYNYDANSNSSQITDAGNYTFGNTYDALNRVVSMTYPDNSTVSMTYNANDDVATVTDPKGLTTSYTYDGFSNVIKIQSPDTGTTLLTYDKKNNLISKQDNKNQVSNYTYDLLGRLKTVNYVGSTSENINLTYDTCKIGNLCTIIDNSGTTTYAYNGKSRLINKTFNPAGTTLTFSTTYTYNSFGNVSSVNYPSITAPGFNYTGSAINYNYENGKIKDISKSITTPIITNITYATLSSEPTSFTAGLYNHSKDINQDGVFNSINNSQTNSYSKDYTYDSRFNIKSINGQAVPVNKSLSAVYDSKSRIVGTGYSEGGVSTSFGYGYNTSDDRTVATKASGNYNYSYPTDSHKLTAITGVNEFTYDLNGNIITSSNNGVTEITMGYNNANRLISSNSSLGDATYTYNALNQRVKKIVNLGGSIETTWFIYDENGQLIADYINKNNVWSVSEYVYLYDKPVAIIRDSSIYHIQTDHINTPRSITKAIDGSLVWSWENKEVFGNNLPNENLSANIFKFNLRFMGQYYDEEKGTSYNYHRDYASGMGRYIQSDPIGLAGGVNTYGYVSGNSLTRVDPLGLQLLDLTTIAGLRRNTTLDDAVKAGEFTRRVIMPSIVVGLSPSAIGLAGSTMLPLVCGTSETMIVTRWGREGLESGDWVMKGGKNYWTYLKSGKIQPGFGNEFASYKTGISYTVPKKSLTLANENIIVNLPKRLLGQRKYTP